MAPLRKITLLENHPSDRADPLPVSTCVGVRAIVLRKRTERELERASNGWPVPDDILDPHRGGAAVFADGCLDVAFQAGRQGDRTDFSRNDALRSLLSIS